MKTMIRPVLKRWKSFSEEERAKIVTSAWCAGCGQKTTIVIRKGEMVGGDLLLTGWCKRCEARVARVIESG